MDSTEARVEHLRRLAQAGIDDSLVLRRETAEEVLTEKRMELINEVADNDIASMRGLARRVNRDISIVSRDLDVLFEAEVIDFEQDGGAKRPVLAHKNVLVEPIVFEGEVIDDDTADSESEVAAS